MATSASPSPREANPITEAARAALTQANGDVQAATRLLEARVRRERKLRDALTDPLLAEACYSAVRLQCRATRRQIWTPSAAVAERTRREGAARVVQIATAALLAFPLPGGKKLGEATRAEIAEAASFYEAQSQDMGAKARWLRLVAQAVTGRKKAGTCLTEERLRELQDEARRDA